MFDTIRFENNLWVFANFFSTVYIVIWRTKVHYSEQTGS